MRDQFDISGVFETTKFEIAQVACMFKSLYNWIFILVDSHHRYLFVCVEA